MRQILFLIAFVSIFSSCVNAQKKALDRVLALEAKLKLAEDASANRELAIEVVAVYPEIESKPELLFKSGEVLKGLGENLKAAKSFYKVHHNFPKSKLAPLALFYQAHCFEVLEQRLTAKNTYQEFIDRYPNHPYVAQAEGMIQLLHYSDEELIKQFQN
jgi:TolA-binding protein